MSQPTTSAASRSSTAPAAGAATTSALPSKVSGITAMLNTGTATRLVSGAISDTC